MTDCVSITTGGFFTCALFDDGTVRCWGYNYHGQLGDGTTTDSNVPVLVSGLSNVSSISAGDHHTCAVMEDGTARCWGDNYYGQLGDGTTTDSKVPVVVSGLSNVYGISAGGGRTCAVLVDGTAHCWGDTTSEQLGDGNYTTRAEQVGLRNVRSISSGRDHTCAVLDDGTARCWGHNVVGQLGDGTTIGSTVPVVVSGCEPALSTSNYTECRQVIHFEALTMYSKPCKYATPLKVAIAPCQRFEYLAAAKPQVSDCASEDGLSCWIEVIYNGTHGWIVAGLGASCAGNSLPSDVALVAYCPACRVQEPPSTCRQVTHNETLTLKRDPCFGSATVFVNNTPAELVRGDTNSYINNDSMQTSMCKIGAASDPPGSTLCWVQGSYKGVVGWLPVARGTFKDAFCSADPQAAQSFVTDSCACVGLPTAAKPINSLGWPLRCKGMGHGATCTAACKSGFAGIPLLPRVTCISGRWSTTVKGQCRLQGPCGSYNLLLDVDLRGGDLPLSSNGKAVSAQADCRKLALLHQDAQPSPLMLLSVRPAG